MSREICARGDCTSPAMPRGAARRAMGHYGLDGLCSLHALRAAVELAAKHQAEIPYPARDYVPADPYRDWLNEVLATGTLAYKGHTVRDLRRKSLAKILGIHEVTISKIANGHTAWVRTRVWRSLTPFMVLCSTSPDWTVAVGQRVDRASRLRYVPPGTGVVDGYGRLWQLRDGGWCPAHPPGKTSRYLEGSTYKFRLPVRVVYLPPVLQADTTA